MNKTETIPNAGVLRKDAALHHDADHGEIHLPAPTSWPIVLALGITLLFTGMLTHWAISLLGLFLMAPAAVGWFLEVLPREHHEEIAVTTEELTVESSQRATAQKPASEERREVHPVERYSLLTGVKGGIAGGIAMTVPAGLYGLIRYHSIWYAINLLAAGGFNSWAGESNAFLAAFHMKGLLAAMAIHGTTSVLVGLLYGAMLPMFPRKPILTAGLAGPLLWTGLLYTSLGIVSPILDQRIDWLWFVVSQIAYGLVTGYVVNLQMKVRTPEFRALPFSVRAGLHTDQIGSPGFESTNGDDKVDEAPEDDKHDMRDKHNGQGKKDGGA